MDDWKGKFALRKILANALVCSVLRRGKIHVVIAYLKEEANNIYEFDVITMNVERSVSQNCVETIRKREPSKMTYSVLSLSACIKRTASLNNPPVLFPTISK